MHGIEGEYDIYYISHKRCEIIETINKAYFNLEGKNIKFAVVNKKSLNHKIYVTSEKDKLANPSFSRMYLLDKDCFCDVEDYLSRLSLTLFQIIQIKFIK